MKKQTKILMRRRKKLIKEWASGPYDWIGIDAIRFSGTDPPHAETDEEYEKQLKEIEEWREKRTVWLRGIFPNEMWRIPILTSMLLPEAGFCYINAAFYATIAVCQAVVESVLRREAGGSEKKYWNLVRTLQNEGKLTAKEGDDLLWLASTRNPTLHTGSNAKCAKALSKGLMPQIANGELAEQIMIEPDCKRALKIVVELLHHLSLE